MTMYRSSFYFLLFLLTSSLALAQDVKALKDVAVSFVETLPEEQKSALVFDFSDSLRTKWTNLPLGLAPRSGVRFGDLSDESKIQFHRVLSTILSSQGYLKVFSIMQVDDILHEIMEIGYQKGQMNENTIKMIRTLDWQLFSCHSR